jgi:hypothetical protein
MNRDRRSDDERPAPPFSFTWFWGQYQYHPEVMTLETPLPSDVVRPYLLSALEFLESRGMLTAAGRKKLASPGWDTQLLHKFVAKAAWGFLDEHYAEYHDYAARGSPPPVDLLKERWDQYAARYDLKKPVVPDPYQAVLQKSQNHTFDDLLRQVGTGELGDISEQLSAAIDFVPASDRHRAETFVAMARGDVVEIARDAADPEVILKILRSMGRIKPGEQLLAAAVILARRTDAVRRASPSLPLLCDAVNWARDPENALRLDCAWHTTPLDDRALLAQAVNTLFAEALSKPRGAGVDDDYLAMCAMRTAGDSQSIKLLQSSVIPVSKRDDRMWQDARKSAIAAIEKRLKGGRRRLLSFWK